HVLHSFPTRRSSDLALDDIAVDPGGTEFQHAVWMALRRVPVGQTTTYAELARAVGAPTAVRAVGAANGANPIWLVIPCHRAIGSTGHFGRDARRLCPPRRPLAPA